MNSFDRQSEPHQTDGPTAGPQARTHARQGGVRAEDGGTPRMVIRGESFPEGPFPESGERYEAILKGGKAHAIAHPLPKPDGAPYAAITDWLNCTFPFNPDELPLFFSRLFECVGENFAPALDRERGLHGWKHSYRLGESTAFFAYGGQGGTGFLSFPGEACHLIRDWGTLLHFIRDTLSGRITRWDGAVDDFEGLHSVDYAAHLWSEGMFTSGGNAPRAQQHGNWIKPDGRGRTLEVGARENGKMLRVYEKGMQLGLRWHPWVRWEVELHNIDRVIPWEVLLEPGKYVAGAYPKALGWVQEEMERIRTIKKTGALSYDHLASVASVAYGKLINVMLAVEGSPEAVVERLRRDGLPARLDLPSLTLGDG